MGSHHSCRGRLQTRTWSSCSRRPARLSLRRSCMRARARRAVVSCSSLRLLRRRLPSVSLIGYQSRVSSDLLCSSAKFQQYMYGGRPLGKPILPREFTGHSLKYYTQTCVSTTDCTHSLQVLPRAVKLLLSPLTAPKLFHPVFSFLPCFVTYH